MYQPPITARIAPLLLTTLLLCPAAWSQDPEGSVSAEDVPLDADSAPTLEDVAEEAALDPVPDETASAEVAGDPAPTEYADLDTPLPDDDGD